MKQTDNPMLDPSSDAAMQGSIDDSSRRRFMMGLGAGALLLGLGVRESTARSLSPSLSAPAGSPLITGRFTHPGLLVNEDDFTRIRNKVKNGEQPWTKWWQTMCASNYTSLTAKPNPQPACYRGDGSKWALYEDIERAFCCALAWKISGEEVYAKLAVETLDAWSSTLKFIGTVPPGSTGHDDHTYLLMCGMQGYQFANAAEIMRTYSGWSPAGIARFQDMLRKVFAPPITSELQGYLKNAGWRFANWDYAALAGTLAIGVFCDDIDLYKQAVDYYLGNNHGDVQMQFGNGMAMHSVYFMHPGYLGQWQESGRDQGHSTLGMQLGGHFLEMAWKQGDDLYSAFNNRFLAGAEYVAKSNLLDTNGKQYVMPFARQYSPTGLFTAAANQSGRALRGCWETLYNHYVNRMGIDAPYISQMAHDTEFTNPNGGSDDMAYSTLWNRRDDYAGPLRAPFGVSAFCSEGKVTLSWWGGKGTEIYLVKRSHSANGPFTIIGGILPGHTRTFSDTPAQGVWYYQVQASNSTSAVSAPIRVAVPGELRCSMDLADGSGSTAVGWVTTPDGQWVRGDGTLMNGASWGAGRLSGKAVVFDGKQSYVQLPAGMLTDVADFTMTMWTFANAPLHWDTCLLFIGLDGSANMFLAPLAGSGKLRFGITASGLYGQNAVEANQALPFRRWVHVAVTLSGGTAKIYIDGQLAGRDDSFELSPRQLLDQKRLLGWNGVHPAFNGRIQDFRFYSKALSDAEIAALAK